jgi:NADH:ubiquinone oxidoreductase subunit E
MTTVPDFEPWFADVARDLVAEIAQGPGPVLLSLQAIQNRFGYVPADAIGLVAEVCNVSRADVHGVFTFYSDLRSTPPPAIPVRLCAAEACQAVGGRELQRDWRRACEADPRLAEATGVDEPIFCLGNCALGPAAMVGRTLVARASVESITHAVRARTQVSGS